MVDEKLIKIANTPDTHFLLQAELKAIKEGLKFEQYKYPNGNRYKGYFTFEGDRQGVGIFIFIDGEKQTGEWHLNKLHGSARCSYPTGNSYWGEYKDGINEGYGTFKWANGERYKGQLKQGKIHGYGIDRWADGEVHYGEHKQSKKDGHGYYRWANGDEYYGQFKDGKEQGEGIKKESD